MYPLELTVLSHRDYKFECNWKLPGYQGPLSSMEAELHMQRLGYKWQRPPHSIWCSGDKVYFLRE